MTIDPFSRRAQQWGNDASGLSGHTLPDANPRKGDEDVGKKSHGLERSQQNNPNTKKPTPQPTRTTQTKTKKQKNHKKKNGVKAATGTKKPQRH